eukprot:CAMPEP_0118968762 /NCGR_PEP_ID=MMETSP1173-20130426/5953_1 /TAXON_ID=1034831 /ORGANISM="Rhizochromulina marina cf, Strain CCMP1243" /LENGTH=75 /DNA_ID=CAMNT_0006917921 /DNA_START=43 /DNA_END=267 /DNA_ORIENTATION=+
MPPGAGEAQGAAEEAPGRHEIPERMRRKALIAAEEESAEECSRGKQVRNATTNNDHAATSIDGRWGEREGGCSGV